jgi:FKBP-type peptidyl-prolyl cis-trans isomerase FklB
MKKIIIASLITLVGFSVNAQTKKATATVKKPAAKTGVKPVVNTPMFKNNLDSASYALGINVANSFKSGGLNTINYTLFNKGLKDVFAKANPTLTQEQCQQSIQTLFESFSKQREELAKKNEEVEKQKFLPNVNAGNQFLAANKLKAGVITTASGLQYEVITQGAGAKPKTADQVTVNYKGTLLNGVEFDSSYKRGEAATFGLNQVIAGWTEGVQLMQEGSKYRFFVPYNLGYGARATPDGSIPPFSTLIFEIELIKVGQ